MKNDKLIMFGKVVVKFKNNLNKNKIIIRFYKKINFYFLSCIHCNLVTNFLIHIDGVKINGEDHRYIQIAGELNVRDFFKEKCNLGPCVEYIYFVKIRKIIKNTVIETNIFYITKGSSLLKFKPKDWDKFLYYFPEHKETLYRFLNRNEELMSMEFLSYSVTFIAFEIGYKCNGIPILGPYLKFQLIITEGEKREFMVT